SDNPPRVAGVLEVSGMSSRLEELRWAAQVTRESIAEAAPDKRSPLIAQYRGVLAEIAELEADVPEGEVNGLVILQEELAKRRQSGAAGSPHAASRRGV